MDLITIQLQQFVRESINPQKFIGKTVSSKDFGKWKDFLAKEINSLNLAVLNLSFHNNGVEKVMLQLVNLSDIVNSYIFKKSLILRNHSQARLIREHYIYTIERFDELISILGNLFPNEAGKIKIADSKLFNTISDLKGHYRELINHLRNSDAGKDLVEIVLLGICKMIHKKNITRNEVHYIESLIFFLLKNEVSLDNRRLSDLLIIHDFNIPDFYRYCVDNWKVYLIDLPGLHEQKEMLLVEKDRLFNLFTAKGLIMPYNMKSLFMELDEFLKEKYTLTNQLIKLRRKLSQDQERTKAGIRFLVNLPVSQFGLFIRIQIEKGILIKENLGELFTFFATHFYTPNTLYISAESLQKKSTDVEFATAQKLKGHLIGMLNWLNTNYNLSNYN
ncbi:hypothetical protein [Mucilaginibacter segetis]|uniref:Uncharacterized protein n=1 Tax=Mucilaginibacter segetis TaxID=2793071 RepID=A0A934PSL8_9SPHI|nr:hypothetical protein [Mucilaginibacter segetis]MBK0380059.1 hypothetical protein [Mucilaginibacter segetis]